jgi:hypothetical protein
MNNTKTRAIVAVLAAATLVVGLTVAATMTPSAFAGGNRYGQDKYVKGGGGQSNGGKDYSSDNGNTKTIQVLKQNAKSSASDGYKKGGQDKYMKGHDGYKKGGQDKYMKGHDGYKKGGQDKYMKGHDGYKKGGQDTYNKGTRDNGKEEASVVVQNGENSICTHPGTSPDSTDLVAIGSNHPGSCTSQSNAPPALGVRQT